VGQTAKLRVVSADPAGKLHRQLLSFRIPRFFKVGSLPIPVKPGKFTLGVQSGAFTGSSMTEGGYFASDNDRTSYYRFVADIWSGRSSLRNRSDFDDALARVFHRKAKLKLSLPWSRKTITFPLRGGGDVLIGNATRKVRLLAATGGGSGDGKVR
jgi:hypothetical protein